MEKDLLADFKEKQTTITLKEFNQDGVMMQVNAMGEVKGKYHANHIETSDTKMKIDGTMEWEARGMETTKEGDVILTTGKGTGRQEKPMESSYKGEVNFMTNSPRLSWLNNTKAYVEGMIDQKNGEVSGKMYAMRAEAAPQVATPAM